MSIEVSSGVFEEMLVGVLLAAVLGAYRLISFYYARNKQRKYINKVVRRCVDDIVGWEKNSSHPLKSSFQKTILDRMRKDLLNYLTSARIEISLEEIVEIKKIFDFFDFLDEQNKVPSFEAYEKRLIEPLKKIKWIKLDQTLEKPFSSPFSFWT